MVNLMIDLIMINSFMNFIIIKNLKFLHFIKNVIILVN